MIPAEIRTLLENDLNALLAKLAQHPDAITEDDLKMLPILTAALALHYQERLVNHLKTGHIVVDAG